MVLLRLPPAVCPLVPRPLPPPGNAADICCHAGASGNGDAFDLPDNVSASCYDINQDIARYYRISQSEALDKSREQILWDKYKENSVSGDKHNSLYDAKVIRELYQILNNVDFDKQ